MDPQFDEAVAYHEAGHAVVALALGRPVQHVSVLPDREHRGWCAFGKGAFRPSADWIEREILILLAGIAAEARHTGDYAWDGAARDLQYVRRLTVERAGERRAERLERRLLSKVEHLLAQQGHWHAVERIVAQLLLRGVISGRAARHLFDQVRCMLTIYLDADACPVKDEVYRVARRYSMRVAVVANMPLRVPANALVELVERSGFGEVDDWIAEQSGPGDIVITADIPLAARCLVKGAKVLDPKGRPFTDNDIGSALAMRALMNDLRQVGTVSGGPAPMTGKDRSQFLSKLDEAVNAVRRAYPPQS